MPAFQPPTLNNKPSEDIKVRDSATKEEFNRQLLLILQELHKTLTLLDCNCSSKNKRVGQPAIRGGGVGGPQPLV